MPPGREDWKAEGNHPLPEREAHMHTAGAWITHWPAGSCVQVVRPGRRFLSALLDLLPVAKKWHHLIHLNSSFKADLKWWASFLQSWNGISILFLTPSNPLDDIIWLDASGTWGCGDVWRSHWIQISWAQLAPFSSASIAVKEMLPITIAACRWGQQWRGCLVQLW